MRKLGILFPGQGTQAVGMGKTFIAGDAAPLYRRASEILGYDLAELSLNGPIDKLTESQYCQPALFVHQYVAAKFLQKNGNLNNLSIAMGLSIGELTALALAEVFDFETGVKIVQKRGQFIQSACENTQGGMTSILGAKEEDVKKLCEICNIEMSNVNGPGQIVLAGTKENIQRAVETATEVTGGKTITLNVAGAFHSSMMVEAKEKFAAFLEDVEFQDPKMAVVSNVTGEIVGNALEIKKLLPQQIVSSVLWWKCMNTAIANGVTHFYQCGSGKTLANMAKRIDPSVVVLPFGEIGDPVEF